MRFRMKYRYQTDVDTLMKLFMNRDYLLQKYEATGARNAEVLAHRVADGRFELTTRREVEANVPDSVRRFVPATNVVTQVEVWQFDHAEEKTGSYKVTIDGVPIRVRGDMVIRPHELGCEHEVEVDIKVSLPVIGNRVARLTADDTKARLLADYEYNRTALAASI